MRLILPAVALTLVGAAPAALLPPPLLPLTEADFASTSESGCQFAFSQGRDTYLFLIGHSLLMRTASGLNTCRVTEAQFQAFGDGPTTISCGGRELSVRRTGPVKSHPEADSADGPAALTMTEGGHRRTVRGTWGSAC